MKRRITTGAAGLISLNGEENYGGAAVKLKKILEDVSLANMRARLKMKMKSIQMISFRLN